MPKSGIALGETAAFAGGEPHHHLRRIWTTTTAILVGAIFLQAVFAGSLLSGDEWARSAHRMTAFLLSISTVVIALVALATLRSVPNGSKLGMFLAGLALFVLAQTAVGRWLSGGTNLMWLHVPLGVALVGAAAQVLRKAGQLGASQADQAKLP